MAAPRASTPHPHTCGLTLTPAPPRRPGPAGGGLAAYRRGKPRKSRGSQAPPHFPPQPFGRAPSALRTARDPVSAPSGTPERPNSGGGDYAVMAALGNGRLLSIVTGARSRLPGTPPDHGAHNAAWAAGGDHHPPLPQPGAGNPPSRPAEPRGESSKGAPGEQSPPLRGRPRAHNRLRMPPSPGPGSFGVQPGPPQQRPAVPGRGRQVSSAASSAPRPAIPGDAHPPRPRSGQRQPARGLARRVSPGGPMGARRSERSPYMDMFWGRARRRPARAPRSA
ncbi:hypothetical protein DBR06_SOUSAS4110133 [Sousa chinensis]|nr:hypothetical protein DBR06_SOUSAS4110133 [Sousa chinensis]